MGLTLVRHDASYELSLQAETLAIGSAAPAAPEGEDDRARLDERVTQLRHLLETLDLMYQAFLRRRLGDDWPKELTPHEKMAPPDGRNPRRLRRAHPACTLHVCPVRRGKRLPP